MDTPVIRNYTVEVDKEKKQSVFKVYPVPVEVMTPTGWVNIREEYEELFRKQQAGEPLLIAELQLIKEYEELLPAFSVAKLQATIIVDTDDPSGIQIVGRDDVPHVLEAEESAQLVHRNEFVYVKGASNIPGTIILPYDFYDDVYTVSDADGDGKAELTFVKSKEETGGVRPYYEKKDGKTYIYVNHFSGGGGTQNSPFLVENEDDLNNVRNNLGGWYLQTKDITLTKWQTGAGWEPIGNTTSGWAGFYDGGGYKIRNLFINRAQNDVGLFGYAYYDGGSGAIIQRVRLVNVNIRNTGSNTGALLGRNMRRAGFYYNCVESGTVSSSGTNTGGMFGALTCNNSSFVATIRENLVCKDVTVQSENDNCAGFSGYVYYGTFTRNFSAAKVEDISIAKNRAYHGGFLGYYEGASGFYDNYWDMDASTKTVNSNTTNFGGVTGLTTVGAKTKTAYNNWEWSLVWHMDPEYNYGYPELRTYIWFKRGKGTKADPFLINTEFELSLVRWHRNSHFRQEDDIKMISHQTGEGFMPLSQWSRESAYSDLLANCFTGTYDGNGRSISNLYINRPSVDYQSLFGITNRAEIKNLDLIDFDITGNDYAAPFVGHAVATRLYNCHSLKFTVSKVVGGNFVAGLVGRMCTNAIVEYCTAENIRVTGVSYTAGIVGRGSSDEGTYFDPALDSSPTKQAFPPNNPYVDKRVMVRFTYVHLVELDSSGDYGAGMVGSADTMNIEDCYTRAVVLRRGTGFGGYLYDADVQLKRNYSASYHALGNSLNNGFWWYNRVGFQAGTIDNFYDREVSKNSDGSGTPKYTLELKNPVTFKPENGWDFVNNWILDKQYNDGYPALRKLLPIRKPILGFRNEYGKYYTDNAGQLLRYLEFGQLIAGSTSQPKPIWVQNNADFSVNNLTVFIDPATVKPGMDIKISQSDSPFVPSDSIVLGGTFAPGEAGKLFVRVASAVTVKDGGTFDIRAKASPV